jgi:autotransporter-associated beta strand protein
MASDAVASGRSRGFTVRLPRQSIASIGAAVVAALLSLSAVAAHAQNATWNLNGNGDFNTNTNWTPGTVPTGTAFFGVSNQNFVAFSANTTTIGGWTFNAGASNYNFSINSNNGITFNGAGIVLNGGAVTITNNTVLDFSSSSTAGRATIINNSNAAGFRGSSTAGNATIINQNGAVLSFQDSSTAGNATIVINGTPNSGVQFSDASTAGNAIINNNSQLTFFNNSTAGNATINNDNQLLFQGNSNAGTATIINNNQLTFSNTSTGGTARLINGDTGQGGTAGTVDISSLSNAGMTVGSIEGFGTIALGSKNLAVGGNNLPTTFFGVLQDGGVGGGTGGSLTKNGTGTLTLAGNNTYTGPTVVNSGGLIVNGFSGSSSLTTVNNGAVLSGTGTVGNTQVNSGGTFAPGSGAPGTSITVRGNLAFASGAIYLVQLNATSTSSANVTGTASLGGTVQANFALGPKENPKNSYDILHAGGLSGTFAPTVQTTNLPPGFTTKLSYTATDVLLNVTAALGGPQQATGLSSNHLSVAGAINNFFNDPPLPPAFLPLFSLTGGNLANALTLLSGEAATGAQQPAFQLTNQFLNIMLDPFADGRSNVNGGGAIGFAPEREELPDDVALAYAKILKAPPKPQTFDQPWSVWGAGYGGSNRTTGDLAVGGSHDLSASAAGSAAGLDYRLAPGTVVGFALAGAGTNWGLAQGLGGGKSDAFQAGVYGTARWGSAYLAAALAFTNNWMSTDRFAFAGDHLSASFNAQSYGGRVESGYRFMTYYGGLTPYAAIQSQTFHTPGYVETDLNAGGFALGFNSRNATDTRSELGGRFDHLLLLNPEAALTMRTRVAWAHDWVSDPTLTAAFQMLPGTSFIVNGATLAKNSALVSEGAELRLANGFAFLAKFDGEFASHSTTYGGTGTVRYTW